MMFKNIPNLFHIRWQTSSSSIITRIYIVMGFFFVVFIGIDLRLMIVSAGKKFTHQHNALTKSYRRNIVDTNNTIIATNLPIYSLFANPLKIVDKQKALDRLSQIIHLPNKAKVLEELNSGKNFVWIKHSITPQESQLINASGIVGIAMEKSFKRIYPYGNLLAHAIGYVGRDNQGLAGIEKFFDEDLLIDSYSNVEKSGQSKGLELTLDVKIQNIVHEELENAIAEFKAIGGVGVVVNPNTGEIVSLVSKPDYNPHVPEIAKPDQLFNKASLGAYEFGSIFKILTFAIGFETNKTDINRSYDISHLKVGGFDFKDFSQSSGVKSVAEIFAKSSNKGTGMIALDIGMHVFEKYLRTLGIADQVIIEIPEKARPHLPQNKYWSDVSMVTMSFGYGIATSVLNLMQAVIPTINGGVMYPLTLVKSDLEPEGRRVFSAKTSQDICKLLRLVVTQGSGKRADVPGYLVGGKSGTANKIVGKHYSKNSRRSSFIAAFPIHDPRYLVYVMLDDPQATKDTGGLTTGGVNAAPTVGRIISRIGSIKGMLSYDENDPLIKQKLTINKADGV